MNIISELKRRNVIRMAGLYFVALVGGSSRPERSIRLPVGPRRPSYGEFNEIFK